MSKHQSKQDAPVPVSKTKLWQGLVHRLAVKLPTDTEVNMTKSNEKAHDIRLVILCHIYLAKTSVAK